MKILVTGNTGFLGRHLTPRIISKGHSLYVCNTKINNLLKPIDPEAIPEKIDIIYHLAAWTKAGTFPLEHKGDLWEKNQLINSHIMSYWLRHQSQALMIAIGTSCAYSPGMEMCEDNYLKGEPDPDMYGYALCKRMILSGLRCFNEQYGMRYRYFIPSTLCGPCFEITDTHFNFDLIKKICAGKYANKKVVLWGDGHQCRELVDVADLVDILLYADLDNQCVNVTTGQEHSIRYYAEIICKIIGYDFDDIIWDTSKWVGVRSKQLVNTKLRDFQFRDTHKTLEDTVNYYLNL